MKVKKSLMLTVAVSFAGIVALTFSGCEWFSFDKDSVTNAAETLGYPESAGAWLASSVSSPRSEALKEYQDAVDAGFIDPATTTFLDYLKAIHDDSASLTSPLRASVAIATSSGMGSGVIYSYKSTVGDTASAYVITNHHVVNSDSGISTGIYAFCYGDRYEFKLNEDTGKKYLDISEAMRATYVGGSAKCDIAVLEVPIPAEKIPYVQTVSESGFQRNSDDATVGEKIYAVGNPLGLGLSVLSGTVSVEAEYVDDFLSMRIDAPVNHGNSGGGLFDADGRLLGIVYGGKDMKIEGEDIAVTGFGYAIPVNRAVSVAQSIIDNATGENKAPVRARLGTTKIESSRGVFNETTQSIDLIETVSISGVPSQSPFAEKDFSGKLLKKITVMNGAEVTVNQDITRQHQVETVLFNVRKGDKVILTFADGSTEEATYNADTHFESVK